MQIHEMFQRKTLTEVDLVGPSSIFNVGKEALKDPKSWVSSNALGAAKQRAAGNFAKQHAPEVTKIAQSNIAPLAKQLAQGWRQIASQLPSPIASPTTVPGTAAKTFAQQPAGFKAATTNQPTGIPRQYKSPVQPTSAAVKTQPIATSSAAQQPSEINPDGSITIASKKGKEPSKIYPTDPRYKSFLAAIKQSSKTPRPVTEDAAGDYRTEFINYARKVLGASPRGVDINALRNDPATNQALNRVISQITATHNDPDKQQLAVEKYFTTALNKWNEIQQDPVKYNQAFAGRQAPARASTGASVRSGEADQDLKEILNKLGITGAQLSGLTKYAIEANKGSPDFRATGNPIWDAVLKTSGMRPK